MYKENIAVGGVAQFVGSLSTMITVQGLIPSTEYNQVCQHTSVIPTLEKWRQKDERVKVILSYVDSLRTAWAT